MQPHPEVLPLTAPAAALKIKEGALNRITQDQDASPMAPRENIENGFQPISEMVH